MNLYTKLLNMDFPLEYFYCSLDNKDFILAGDCEGVIYETDKILPIGNILIELVNNYNNIILILNKYKEYIEKISYKNDSEKSQNLVLDYLCELQQELNKQSEFFNYINIPIAFSKNYIKLYEFFMVNNRRHNVTSENLRKIVRENPPENINGLINEIISYNEKGIADNKDFKETTFKKYTTKELQKYIDEFELAILNILVFYKMENEVNIKCGNDIFKYKNDFIAYNYNLVNEFRTSKSFIKGVCFKDNKLFIDENLSKLKNADIKFIQIYQFENIIELLNLAFVNAINKNIHINICKNCKKAFIPINRTDEKYCNNPSPQNPNKTCKEIGAKVQHEINLSKIKKEHEKANQFFRNKRRLKDEKLKADYEKVYIKFTSNYNKKKKQFENGNLTEQDFIEWIKNQKGLNK